MASTSRLLLPAFLLAALLHAAVIFIWRMPSYQPPEFAVVSGVSSLEVELIAPARPESEMVASPTEPPEELFEETIPDPLPEAPPEPVVSEAVPAAMVAKPAAAALPVAAPSKPRGAAPVRSGAPAAAKPVASGAQNAKPGYLRNPHPTYPEAARQAGLEGVVLLRVSVSAAGAVTSVRVERSSGHTALDQKALTTVRERWKFKPALWQGQRVASEIAIPIRFSLN